MATIQDYESFDCDADCEALNGAMEGLGTNEDMITETITKRSNAQRLEVKERFPQMFGKRLEDALKDELGGNYEDVVLALFKSPVDLDASELHDAIKGAGTSEGVLIEILCSRTNEEISNIKEAYTNLYDADLLEDIESDTSGAFGKLMFSLAQGCRNEDEELDEDLAAEDAQALVDAGEAQWGTDESRFNVVLASRSYWHLIHVFDLYETLSEKKIEEAIESEMSGDVKEAMLAIVKCVYDKTQYFCERIYNSMKGAGTDDRTLIRVVVSRSEIDLATIQDYFAGKYEQTVSEFIEDDCGGDYKRALLHLCAGNN